MQVAEMYQLLGESEKSIELSYLAYKKGQSSPDIHRSYLSIFLHLEIKNNFERDVVQEEFRPLSIANEQGERWITILSLLQPEEASESVFNSVNPSKVIFRSQSGGQNIDIQIITKLLKE